MQESTRELLGGYAEDVLAHGVIPGNLCRILIDAIGFDEGVSIDQLETFLMISFEHVVHPMSVGDIRVKVLCNGRILSRDIQRYHLFDWFQKA